MSSSLCTTSSRLGGYFDLSIEVLDDRPGYLALRATGKDAVRAFQHEGGGHRWQRVPPTEKRGRVHTSTVTVAVMLEPTDIQLHIDERDLEIKTCRGSGAGGQKVNKTSSTVIITHKPSKMSVRCESERSQSQNKASALSLLRARLLQQEIEKKTSSENNARKGQVGSGMRGDKRRTVALQRDQVTDHVTGKETSSRKYLKGMVEDLW